MNNEAMIVVLATLCVLLTGIIVLLFFINVNLIRKNTDEIQVLKVLIDSIVEIFDNKYKYDEGKDEERN